MHRRRTRPHGGQRRHRRRSGTNRADYACGTTAPLPVLDGGARSREPHGSYRATIAPCACMRGLEARPGAVASERMLTHRGAAQQRGAPDTCTLGLSALPRPAGGRRGTTAPPWHRRNGRHRRIHTRSCPSGRAVRRSMSKHNRFFDKLERRAPKKRCRRCRQKFTPPAGHTSLICPPCRRIEKTG